MRSMTLVVSATLLAAAVAGCSRTPRTPTPGDGVRSRASLDSATVARLCVPADSALVGTGACELRDQAPPPIARPRP
jgi:uncharacterized lipoprotein